MLNWAAVNVVFSSLVLGISLHLTLQFHSHSVGHTEIIIWLSILNFHQLSLFTPVQPLSEQKHRSHAYTCCVVTIQLIQPGLPEWLQVIWMSIIGFWISSFSEVSSTFKHWWSFKMELSCKKTLIPLHPSSSDMPPTSGSAGLHLTTSVTLHNWQTDLVWCVEVRKVWPEILPLFMSNRLPRLCLRWKKARHLALVVNQSVVFTFDHRYHFCMEAVCHERAQHCLQVRLIHTEGSGYIGLLVNTPDVRWCQSADGRGTLSKTTAQRGNLIRFWNRRWNNQWKYDLTSRH